jgi:fatty acid desaturase
MTTSTIVALNSSTVLPATTAMAPELQTDGEATERFRSVGFYRKALSADLSPGIFKPYPLRLLWYTACCMGAIFGFVAIVSFDLAWPLKLLCGVLIGLCNGTLGFICHEILHGSVIKNQRAQSVLSFFGSMPFLISPTYWRFSHNRLHHGKTQALIRDPDAFPNLRIFKSSPFMKFMFPYTPGSGHRRSSIYFFFWFSFHNLVAQIYMRFRNNIYEDMNHKRASLELAGQALIFLSLFIYAGPANWLWAFVVPLALQNYLLMSYISTNHNLSPLTAKNDPLINSLSVTNHPVIEFLNLNFGYHVEHHIFPSVSGQHIKAVHHELIKQFPKSYQVMPKWKAMRALYASPRIYKNASELVHPRTLKTYPTLEPEV